VCRQSLDPSGAGYQHLPAVVGSHRRDTREGVGAPDRSWCCGSRQGRRPAYAESHGGLKARSSRASRGGMRRTATAVLMLLSAVQVAGAAGTGDSADGAVDTAAVSDATTRQEQVLGEVLGRLRSLEGETARLAEAQRAAEARHVAALSTVEAQHTAAVAALERRVSDLEKGGKQWMSRSRKQASSPACGAARSQGVMDACCPTTGGHRRLQTQCALPSTCGTLHCADVFTSFYEDCTQMVGSSPAYQHFYANCQELKAQSAQMLLQLVTVQMFKVHIATNVTMGPPRPASSLGGSSSALQEYHAVCSSAAISGCVPTCNATHHGYELLATIDGTDTKFSCNVAHGLYSWAGVASEGGYLGHDSASFISAVLSGAAGTYAVTLAGDVQTTLHLQVQPGQNVHISGDPGLPVAPSWGGTSMATINVKENGKALLTYVFFTDKVTVEAHGVLFAQSCIFGKGGVGFNGVSLQLTGGQASVRECTFGTTWPSAASGATLTLSNTPLCSIPLRSVFANMDNGHNIIHFSNVALVDCPTCEHLTGIVSGDYTTRNLDGTTRDFAVQPPALAANAACCSHHTLARGGWCGGAQSNTWCFPQHVTEVRCNDDC
jgi:hypothetical protein